MAKYCKAYKLKVTYLDCLECETKECKQKVKKAYLELEPEQKVFLVYKSKREGNTANIVFLCNVKEIIVRKHETLYRFEKQKIVCGKKELQNKYMSIFNCLNANINTGYRGNRIDCYPVFTEKEECIKWLRDL